MKEKERPKIYDVQEVRLTFSAATMTVAKVLNKSYHVPRRAMAEIAREIVLNLGWKDWMK